MSKKYENPLDTIKKKLFTLSMLIIGGIASFFGKEKIKGIMAENQTAKELEKGAKADKERSFNNLDSEKMGPNLKRYMEALKEKYPELDEIMNSEGDLLDYPDLLMDLWGTVKALKLDEKGIEVYEGNDSIDLKQFNNDYTLKRLPDGTGGAELYCNGERITDIDGKTIDLLTGAFDKAMNEKDFEKRKQLQREFINLIVDYLHEIGYEEVTIGDYTYSWTWSDNGPKENACSEFRNKIGEGSTTKSVGLSPDNEKNPNTGTEKQNNLDGRA